MQLQQREIRAKVLDEIKLELLGDIRELDSLPFLNEEDFIEIDKLWTYIKDNKKLVSVLQDVKTQNKAEKIIKDKLEPMLEEIYQVSRRKANHREGKILKQEEFKKEVTQFVYDTHKAYMEIEKKHGMTSGGSVESALKVWYDSTYYHYSHTSMFEGLIK